MKSRRKVNSLPLLSQSLLSFYSHADNVEQSEDDSHVGYRMEKYSDECDFITFHEDAFRPNKSEQRERRKEAFYSKSSDLYGYSVYENGETPTGCGIMQLAYLDSLDQQDIDEMEDDVYQDYDNCYVWLNGTSKLFYVKDRHIEAVNIFNLEQFQKSLATFMEDDDCRYTAKRMSYDEVYELISVYSYHVPEQMANQQCPNSQFTFGVLMALKKNERPLKVRQIAAYDEENDLITFYASDSEECSDELSVRPKPMCRN